MKNVILIFVLTIVTTGCIKKYNGSDNADESGFTGSKNEIKEYFSAEVISTLDELGYNFNTGGNPPDLKGSYFANSFTLKSSNVTGDTPGMSFVDYTYSFSNQSSDKIDCSSSSSVSNESGVGSFISGSGNDFSIYVKQKVL